jgi:hypothetical protein
MGIQVNYNTQSGYPYGYDIGAVIIAAEVETLFLWRGVSHSYWPMSVFLAEFLNLYHSFPHLYAS